MSNPSCLRSQQFSLPGRRRDWSPKQPGIIPSWCISSCWPRLLLFLGPLRYSECAHRTLSWTRHFSSKTLHRISLVVPCLLSHAALRTASHQAYLCSTMRCVRPLAMIRNRLICRMPQRHSMVDPCQLVCLMCVAVPKRWVQSFSISSIFRSNLAAAALLS